LQISGSARMPKVIQLINSRQRYDNNKKVPFKEVYIDICTQFWSKHFATYTKPQHL